MSIGKRVAETIGKMASRDPEGALFQICSAIDVTAAAEYKQKGKSSYKRFLHDNLGLITDIAFGGKKILNINLEYDHPNINKTPEGLSSIQDIIYHAVRCGLYHEAGLRDDLKFTDEQKIYTEGGILVLPSSLIYGLTVAVVVSPSNEYESSPKPSVLNFGNFSIPISKLWGRRAELLWLLEVEKDVKYMQQRSKAK